MRQSTTLLSHAPGAVKPTKFGHELNPYLVQNRVPSLRFIAGSCTQKIVVVQEKNQKHSGSEKCIVVTKCIRIGDKKSSSDPSISILPPYVIAALMLGHNELFRADCKSNTVL